MGQDGHIQEIALNYKKLRKLWRVWKQWVWPFAARELVNGAQKGRQPPRLRRDHRVMAAIKRP